MKKKIIVDLDVVTVALWDKKGKNTDIAKRFLERIAKGEFYVATPFFLIETVLKWNYKALKQSIKNFYVRYSNKLFTDEEIKDTYENLDIDYVKIIYELENSGIKKEDAALIFVASIFSFDYLVTFNRVHLKNKKEVANKILKKWKLPSIEIVSPEEL